MTPKRDSRHTIRLDKTIRNMLFSIIHKRSKELRFPVTICSIVDDGIRSIYEKEIVKPKNKKGTEDETREIIQTTMGQSLGSET